MMPPALWAGIARRFLAIPLVQTISLMRCVLSRAGPLVCVRLAGWCARSLAHSLPAGVTLSPLSSDAA
jgi:hypothetical protein